MKKYKAGDLFKCNYCGTMYAPHKRIIQYINAGQKDISTLYCSKKCSGADVKKQIKLGVYKSRGGDVRSVHKGLSQEEIKERIKRKKSLWHKNNRKIKKEELNKKNKAWRKQNPEYSKKRASNPEYKKKHAEREKILRSVRAYGEYGEAHRALIELENQLKGKKDGT